MESEQCKIDLVISFPKGDSTVLGTHAAISEGSFNLKKVRFEKNDVVLDLGCNIGLVSCYIAARRPEIHVYGFDASPLAIKYARLNACQNRILNTTFFNKAIGGSNSESPVCYLSDSVNIATLIEEKLDSEKRTDSYKVDKISIDEIFDSKVLGIKSVKLAKVDIEGGEYEVFEHLFNHRIDILEKIEFLHLEIHGDNESEPKHSLYGRCRDFFGDNLLSSI